MKRTNHIRAVKLVGNSATTFRDLASEEDVRPMVIEFDEQHKFPVDRVVDIRRAACQSVGGVGDRYTCLIQGQESYLWMEKGRWFVAAKE